MTLHYKIIGSSSAGNCVLMDDVMADIGLKYSLIKPYLFKTKFILITHIHGDHLHHPTYKKIRSTFPNIKIIGNHEVNEAVLAHHEQPLDIVCDTNDTVDVGLYQFHPFLAPHNVLCYGYTWKDRDGDQLIYTTDLTTMKYAPNIKYDYLFVEANHDQYKLEALRRDQWKRYGYNAYEGAMRHLSKQDCMTFWLTHRRTPDSPLIELHKSGRFY